MKNLFFILTISLLSLCSSAIAEVKSAEEIIDALKPKPLTRGIRGLRVEDAPKPSTDLTINFEFNSAKLSPDSVEQLQQLATALNSEEILPYRIKVTGHTDAVGSDAYNMDLSKRRAQAVVTYLSSQLGVNIARLYSAGMGKRALKLTDDPENGANRRVEITQIGN
jgi:outer membrane protein OmpA-like peptidoglycan-associated protein